MHTKLSIVGSVWLSSLFVVIICHPSFIAIMLHTNNIAMVVISSITMILGILYLIFYVLQTKNIINLTWLEYIFPKVIPNQTKYDLINIIWVSLTFSLICLVLNIILISTIGAKTVGMIIMITCLILSTSSLILATIIIVIYYRFIQYSHLIKYLALGCLFIGTIYGMYELFNQENETEDINYDELIFNLRNEL